MKRVYVNIHKPANDNVPSRMVSNYLCKYITWSHIYSPDDLHQCRAHFEVNL